ncbi:PAS domain-containing protein [Alphaproteobacteria bacterium GH1-50]|uniref:histidine kinase n=1 Tax=Kangsaoukella pontilimi TaxID=2691042 RepID=A0A7C9IE05_9RHOB|nr:HWE histidine kinase domain-containing protein [Kangsaoukella pontilimi]MXQ06367.1 PAS domain-containing protein [Kangsaoukella pontilimi]
MRDREIEQREYLARIGLEVSAWLGLATDYADVGRWVYDVQSQDCFIDDVLKRLTGIDERQPMPAETFVRCIHESDQGAVMAALEESAKSGSAYDISFRFIRPDGETIWLAGRGQKRVVQGGREVMIGVNYDITALQNAVTANRLLAGEMAHRVKNLLSLVSGMFRMTQRNSDSLESLGESFLGRLNALGRLNDVIFEGEARSASLQELMEAALGSMSGDPRLSLSMPDFRVNGTAAQTLVLAGNELLTNAVKYGALSEEDGQVAFSIEVNRDEDRFVLRWDETVSSGISPPDGASGFGMSVLGRMTQHTFDGSPSFDWRPDGLSFSCVWRASDMSGETGVAANERRLMDEAERATVAVQGQD